MVKFTLSLLSAMALSGAASAQSYPGFDCGKASIDTEYAICSSAVLGLKDRQMNATWEGVQLLFGGSIPGWLDAAQRSWIASRNQCKWDESCIQQSYVLRMYALENLQF